MKFFHNGFEEAFDGASLSMAGMGGGRRMEVESGGERAVWGEEAGDGGERRGGRAEERVGVNCSNGH